MSTRLQSLRKRVWNAEAKDAIREIGEAVRDLYGFVSKLTLIDVVEARAVVWSEPFTVGVDLSPRLVILADARLAGTLTTVATGALDWQLVPGGTGYRAQINRAVNLAPGQQYDLKFLVVF
jgi:hypothetical protein